MSHAALLTHWPELQESLGNVVCLLSDGAPNIVGILLAGQKQRIDIGGAACMSTTHTFHFPLPTPATADVFL